MLRKIHIYFSLTVILCLALIGTTVAAGIPKNIDDVPRITMTELQELQTKESVLIIDTRAPGQWSQAKDKIPGAVRVANQEDLLKLKEEVAPNTPIVTYCT